jgi:hypothetical protein
MVTEKEEQEEEEEEEEEEEKFFRGPGGGMFCIDLEIEGKFEIHTEEFETINRTEIRR